MLLQNVTMYWQYLTSNGFRNYVASTKSSLWFCNKSFVLWWMRLLLNYCNKCCVMLNHYDLGSLWFGLKSLVISWTTGVIWAQVWEFDRFGDCFWTCALIIWTVPWQMSLDYAGSRSRASYPSLYRLGIRVTNNSMSIVLTDMFSIQIYTIKSDLVHLYIEPMPCTYTK
jgi:hypothetical protein